MEEGLNIGLKEGLHSSNREPKEITQTNERFINNTKYLNTADTKSTTTV